MTITFSCAIDLGTGPQVVNVEASIGPKRPFMDPRCPYSPAAVILSLADSAGRIIDRPIPGPVEKALKEEAIAALKRSPYLPQLLQERASDAAPE